MKKGDKVEAKWSGSQKYYLATVLKRSGQHVEVEFDDGSIDLLKIGDVKPLESERKTLRRSRSRSVGRSRTQRSASRSPTRKSKEVSKQEKKTTNQKSKTSDTKEVKSKTSDIKKKSSDNKVKSSDSKEKITQSKSKSNHSTAEPLSDVTLSLHKLDLPLSSSTTNSRSEVTYTEVKEEYKTNRADAIVRTSARIAAKQTHRVSSAKDDSSQVVRRSIRSYSDDDDEETEEEEEEDEVDTVVRRHPLKTFHFGSFLIVLLKTIIPPLFILFLCSSCSKKTCTIYGMPPLYNSWTDFMHDVKFPLLSLLCFHSLLTIFSKIPVGPQVSGYEQVQTGKLQNKHRLNGFYLLLLAVTSFAVAFYFKVYTYWGYEKIKPIVISAVIYTFISSLFMHFYGLIKKHDVPEDKPHHRAVFLGDFYYGLQTNPFVFGREDVKTRFIQFGLIGLVLMDISIVTKFFMIKGVFPVPLTLTAAMQIFFVLDYLWREENMLSTATYTEDGVGFGFITGIGCVLPCSFVLQTVFLANQYSKAVHLPHWCSGAIVLLFLCGYALYNISSRLKHNFRKNPFSPALSKLTSIPTSRKKRLITSGLFGVIRHPNYLGLILMATAWSLPCGFTHVLPYMPLLYLVQLLILRTLKVEGSCQEKYGPAWQNYRERVPKRFIPYIF